VSATTAPTAPQPSAAPPAAPFATTIPRAVAGMPLGMPLTGSAQLAGEHFIAAACFLLAGAIGLVWIAPELAMGAYPSPHVAGVTHLFTLGWLTTTIFGAFYQLLPVALRAPIRSQRLGHLSFATFVPGVALFAGGVATGSILLHHFGIALLTIGIVAAVVNVGRSLAGAAIRDVTWTAVIVALTALSTTLVLGVALVHNLHTGFLAEARVRVLVSHLHVALVGWALITIVGMSHRLLPMFLLAHGVDTRWTSRAIALLCAGVIVLAIGVNVQLVAITWLGVALLEGGVIAFLFQARRFFRARIRPRLDAGMRFAATALCFLAAAAILGAFVPVLGITHPRLATAYVLVGLLGGIVLYVVGHFYKIVPFLVWIARFRGRMGKGHVPAVADLYSARVALVQLGAMSVGVLALGGGVLAGCTLCARAGASLFLIGVLLFAVQGVRLATSGREAHA